jgi:hypothetical protein
MSTDLVSCSGDSQPESVETRAILTQVFRFPQCLHKIAETVLTKDHDRFQILSDASLITYSTIRRYTVSLLKALNNVLGKRKKVKLFL